MRDETRERLFNAAAEVFVRNGIAGTSVEEICLEAGLTRGALYSNFANKDELVLAMIDDHVDRNLAEMERLIEAASSTDGLLQLLESPQRRRDGPLGGNPVLHMEFLLHAMRNPQNRPRLAERQRRWRELIATIVRQDFESVPGAAPMAVDEAAELILALDDGYLLHELLEPGSYRAGTFSHNLLVLRSLWLGATRATAPAASSAEADDGS